MAPRSIWYNLKPGDRNETASDGHLALVRPYNFESAFLKYVGNSYKQINGHATNSLTVHLPNMLKGILHAEAIAANKSMSGLVREWIEERLDLPSGES